MSMCKSVLEQDSMGLVFTIILMTAVACATPIV
jgi:hypothetical protein